MSDSGDPKQDKQRELEAEREHYKGMTAKDTVEDLKLTIDGIYNPADSLRRYVKLSPESRQTLFQDLMEIVDTIPDEPAQPLTIKFVKSELRQQLKEYLGVKS